MPLKKLFAFVSAEHRRNPWMLPGVALSASVALGTALPGLVDLAGRLAR